MVALCPPDQASAVARALEDCGASGRFPLALLKRCEWETCRWWTDEPKSVLIASIGGTVLPLFGRGYGREVARWLRSQPDVRQVVLPEEQGFELLESGLLPPHRPPVPEMLATLHRLEVQEDSMDEVRRAVASDFERLAPLYAPGRFGVPEFLPFPERFRLTLDTGRFHYVEREGKPVSACHTLPEAGNAAQVMGVVTDPAWRGKGLARVAVKELCRALLADGLTPHLFYETGSESARRLYGSLGFKDEHPFVTIAFAAFGD